MSDEGIVEGGLAEPAELQPEQGSLALLLPGDEHTRADWEGAAAAVLRKARLLSKDEPDSDVWRRLSRTTLDGIPVSPLGTPALLDGATPGAGPTTAAAIRNLDAAGMEARNVSSASVTTCCAER